MKHRLVDKYIGTDGKEYESPIATLDDTPEYLAVVAFIDIIKRLRTEKK